MISGMVVFGGSIVAYPWQGSDLCQSFIPNFIPNIPNLSQDGRAVGMLDHALSLMRYRQIIDAAAFVEFLEIKNKSNLHLQTLNSYPGFRFST